MRAIHLKKTFMLPQEAADYILKNFVFLGFIFTLMILYIFIVHQGEGKVREYQTLKRDVKELRWQYLTSRSDLMVACQQSTLHRDLNIASIKKGHIPVIVSKD